MNITQLKRDVSKFFRKRKVVLRTLTGRGLKNDDYFELYVLGRLVGKIAPPPIVRQGAAGFLVAVSPSPHFSNASFLEFTTNHGRTHAIRSGLEVQGRPARGTVELDVVVLTLRVPQPDQVGAAQIDAAIECKMHSRAIASGSANEVVGKAFRMWDLPVGRLNGCERYAIASFTHASDNARRVLEASGVAFRLIGPALEDYLTQIVATL